MSSFLDIPISPICSWDSAHLDQQSGRRRGLPFKITQLRPSYTTRLHLVKFHRATKGLFPRKVSVKVKSVKKLFPSSRERSGDEEDAQTHRGKPRFDLRLISTAMTGGIIFLRFAMNWKPMTCSWEILKGRKLISTMARA